MLRRDDKSRRTRKARRDKKPPLDETFLEAMDEAESGEAAVDFPEGVEDWSGRDSGRSRKGRVEEKVSMDEAYLKAMDEAESEPEAEPEEAADEPSESPADQEEPDPQRKTFGASGSAWMKVEVSEDSQQAFLQELSFGDDGSLGAAKVVAALRDLYLITSGIDGELIEELSARAAEGEGVQGNFTIAQGTPPVPGKDGRIDYTFLEGLEKEVKLPFQELKEAFEQTERDAVLDGNLTVRAVAPGEALAACVPPTEGEAGQDVYGNPKTVPGKETLLRTGQNVTTSEGRTCSEVYGYVCLTGDEIAVIPPLWTSPDQMEAHYIHFPQVSPERLPTPDWLGQALQHKGIQHGIDEESIEKLCRLLKGPTKKRAIRIARGTPPVPGIDAHVNYTFDPEKKPGKMLPDGSVDLKERNTVISITADQLLGEIVPATQGRPGTNLMGEEISTTDGEERDFTAGENVRTEDVDGSPKFFYAEIDGAVTVNGEALQVDPIYQVNSDVDYSTGNIDVSKDVQISGSVRTGFTVKAGGNITISETVEDGALIQAKGDVVVAKGIIGETTRVIALGNVETKFIQNSSVVAGENITVGSYIFNAAVRAGGEIAVQSGGGGRGGSIVGGEVSAAKGIEARLIGSSATGGTLVGIGPTPATVARLNKLGQGIDYCDTNILRMLRTLGLQTVDAQTLDAEKIKEIVRRAPKARKQYVVEIVKKLNELVQTREKALKMQQDLEEQVAQGLKEVYVKATEKAFSDITIRIGNDTSTISEDLSQPLFFKTSKGIRWRPLQEPSGGTDA